MLLQGKKALVTGAASGIGRATAIKFAEEGAHVCIADVNEEGLDETAGKMSNVVKVIPFDASDVASCENLVESAAEDGLDVLCNVSGILKWGPTEDFSVADFERVMAINTTSVFALCKFALPHLVKSQGNIVNTASTASLQGLAYTVAYAASKHAVAAITKSLAIEYASRGVRVNAICPGQVNTAMGTAEPPPGEVDWALVMRNAPKLVDGMCEPSDIAELFAWLASDKAHKVTGSLYTMDGGQLAG